MPTPPAPTRVDAATAAGYATFDIDRIGDGNSSHPPSADIDLSAGAVTLHDAVTALRSGAVDGHAFQHVIMVGHSLGSIEAWIEDARYHDVDAVIITGALHAATPNLPALEGDFYPAADDPKFAGSGLDPGYLTTRPGTREALFYDPATTNPAVLALDEADKDTTTAAELADEVVISARPPRTTRQSAFPHAPSRRLAFGKRSATACQTGALTLDSPCAALTGSECRAMRGASGTMLVLLGCARPS